ncbi:MAG: SMI1/KNR4 family protein, partial [Myxococcota bacterium]|nr:SMI1/KNR4 family protein [Myxococcota bacterium]
MSELAATIREALAALAASDRSLARFGANHHRYELAPPLDDAMASALEATLGAPLPPDLRELATTLGAGGAGPYLGWIPL